MICFALVDALAGPSADVEADVLMWFYLDGAAKIPGGLNGPGRQTQDASPAIEPRSVKVERRGKARISTLGVLALAVCAPCLSTAKNTSTPTNNRATSLDKPPGPGLGLDHVRNLAMRDVSSSSTWPANEATLNQKSGHCVNRHPLSAIRHPSPVECLQVGL